MLKHFLSETNGATAVQYSLISSLFAVVLILAATTLGVTLQDMYLEK